MYEEEEEEEEEEEGAEEEEEEEEWLTIEILSIIATHTLKLHTKKLSSATKLHRLKVVQKILLPEVGGI